MNRLGDLFRLLRPHARPHLGALVLIVVFGTASAMLQQGTFLLLLPTWEALFPEEEWGCAHLAIIWFGRDHCPARGHDLEGCPICSWAAPTRRR